MALLKDVRPELEKEWDIENNKDYIFDEVPAYSRIPTYWKCSKCGHRWRTQAIHRACGNGCPKCARINSRASSKGTSFADMEPELLKEWDYEKNDVLPTEISHMANYKASWKCSNGHRWEQLVSSRCNRRSPCPYCSGRLAIPGETDFATLYPNLLKEWDWEANDIDPTKITAGYKGYVHWVCANNHKWSTILRHRTKNKSGCPYCSGKRPIKGVNDLETLYPELIKEWDWEKNKMLPSEVGSKSTQRSYWICKEGHRWQTGVAHRTVRNSGCPFCSGEQPIVGVNDLKTVNPILAEEWNYEKNKKGPEQYLPYSGIRVWWKCKKGHEWRADLDHRSKGDSCPYCSGRMAIPGETDLATVNPELAKEWNYSKNAHLKPTDVTKGSSKRVWWICENGHEWKTSVSSRSRGTGCPICYKNRI